MPKTKSDDLKDEAVVSFEVGKRDDGRLWNLCVTCKEPLTQDEFAASCISLGNDILEGSVDWETAQAIDVQ